MKSLIDIVALSVAFWISAAKLLMAIHPLTADESISDPVVVESQSEQDEANQKTAAAIFETRIAKAQADKLKTEKDEAVRKAKVESDRAAAAESDKQKAAAELAAQRDAARPLAPVEPPPPKKPARELRHWTSDLEEAKSLSRQTGLPMVLDFSQDDAVCANCREAKGTIFSTATVSPVLRGDYIPVFMPVPRDARDGDNHASEYNIDGVPIHSYPAIVVVAPDGGYNGFHPDLDPNKTPEQKIETFLRRLESARKAAISGKGVSISPVKFNLSSTEQRMLDAINRYRIDRKLWVLAVDPVLQRVARERVGRFDHHAFGRWSWEQAHSEGFDGPVTDNLAQDDGPEDAVMAWGDERPGHTVGHDMQLKGYKKMNGQWINERFDACGVAARGGNYIVVLGRDDSKS